jgi:hypothetical protein
MTDIQTPKPATHSSKPLSSHRHAGGCLCGEVRYEATAAPVWTTICHCTFCQKLTGSAFLVEPIFQRKDVTFSGAQPKTFDHRSGGSGKRVTVNFCGACGATLFLSFERFPDVFGLFAGTFDDPNWFDRSPSRHIFTRHAQKGVVLPAGAQVFEDHALQLDGTPNAPTVLTEPLTIAARD